MRLFIALDLDSDAKSKLGHVTQVLRPLTHDGHFYREEQFHLTLYFVGEVPCSHAESTLQELKSLLFEIAQQTEPFAYTLNNLGHFQKKKRHILWAGLSQGAFEVQRLALSLEQALHKLGYPPASPAFSAHVTLGRNFSFNKRLYFTTSADASASASASATELTELEKALSPLHLLPIYLTAQHLTLMESRRIEGDLHYVPIYTAPFK